jgi:hypothetical protein
MKKIIPVLILSLILVSASQAQNKTGDDNETTLNTDSSASRLSWYLSFSAGAGFPVQNWDPTYTVGGGGGILAGYRVDPAWAIQLGIHQRFFTSESASLFDFRILPELRWNFVRSNVSPYLLIGPGFDFQFNHPTGYDSSSFVAEGGLGVQFDLRENEHLFVEGRYNFLIYKNMTAQDIPVDLGITVDL